MPWAAAGPAVAASAADKTVAGAHRIARFMVSPFPQCASVRASTKCTTPRGPEAESATVRAINVASRRRTGRAILIPGVSVARFRIGPGRRKRSAAGTRSRRARRWRSNAGVLARGAQECARSEVERNASHPSPAAQSRIGDSPYVALREGRVSPLLVRAAVIARETRGCAPIPSGRNSTSGLDRFTA